MRNLTVLERNILEMLRIHDLRGKDIALQLNLTPHMVSRIIANIRKKYSNGDANASYIFATKNGYTLSETLDNLHYEGKMRLKKGTSMILNGKHVYNRCKQLDLSSFQNLSLEFFPKATLISNELRKEQ